MSSVFFIVLWLLTKDLSLHLQFGDSLRQAGNRLQGSPSQLLAYAGLRTKDTKDQSSGPRACTADEPSLIVHSFQSETIQRSEASGNRVSDRFGLTGHHPYTITLVSSLLGDSSTSLCTLYSLPITG